MCVQANPHSGLGTPYLYGVTHYGENVEDEWLIVYLLRELTKTFRNLWVRVSDSDGEFLLIEAAKEVKALKWLSPENDANRVWIHNGQLRIIPPPPTIGDLALTTKPLPLAEALTTIRLCPTSLFHIPALEAEAFYRLQKYPAHLTTATYHYAQATIPRKLAGLLHDLPHSIAPAVEAFYLRDAQSLRSLYAPSTSSQLTFPPTDLVTVSIRFTRTLYAQLKSQRFPNVPPAWKSVLDAAEVHAATAAPSATAEAAKKLAKLELGIKLTTGFELLAKGANESASRATREVAIWLEDFEEDGEGVLPTDNDIRGWDWVSREDDDSWMDVDWREFEKELDGKGKKDKGQGFGDAAMQADLRKIVERFEAFLSDERAGIDGAEFEEMDQDDGSELGDGRTSSSCDSSLSQEEDEDKEVQFDEQKFARMMREMMGLKGDVPEHSGKEKAVKETASEKSEDEEIQELMEQFEAELKGHGALDLDPKPKDDRGQKAIKDIKGKGKAKAVESGSEEEDEKSGDEEVDIDYNLAKNLLESFKGQAGMAGPAGNLLGLMGVALPRDDGESDEE